MADSAPTVSNLTASSNDSGVVDGSFTSSHSSGKVKNVRIHYANNSSYNNSQFVDIGAYNSEQNDGYKSFSFNASAWAGQTVYYKLEIKSPSGTQTSPAPDGTVAIPDNSTDPKLQFQEVQSYIPLCSVYKQQKYCVKADREIQVILGVFNIGTNFNEVRLFEDQEDSSTFLTLKADEFENGLAKFPVLYNKEDHLTEDAWGKDITIVAKAYNKQNEVTDEEYLTVRLYDYERFLEEEEKLNNLIANKELKDREFSILDEDYLNTCANKIYESDFTHRLLPQDKRRTVQGEDIFSDIGNEDLITYSSKVRGIHPYTIKVQYNYGQTGNNYPAHVSVEFDIKGAPNNYGTRNRLSMEVLNFDDKELAKELLLQKVYTTVIDSACSNEVLLDADSLFKYEKSLGELVEQLPNLSNREVNIRRLLFGDEFVDIALEILSGIEKEVATENIFDVFSTLDEKSILLLMLSEHPQDKLIFDYLETGDYLDNEDIDVLMALYHITRLQMDFDYKIPNDRNYLAIAISEKFKRALGVTLEFILTLIADFAGGVPQTEASYIKVLKSGYEQAKKITPDDLVITTKQATKMLLRKRGAVRFSVKRGIYEHKKWAKKRIYDQKYGAEHKHEFSIKIPTHLIPPRGKPKSYRLDAIKFDKNQNQIIIRELKPDNLKAIKKGEKQLAAYKEVIEFMAKNGDIPNSGYPASWLQSAKVIINKVDTYD